MLVLSARVLWSGVFIVLVVELFFHLDFLTTICEDNLSSDDDLRDWYLALTDSNKLIFLALVSFDLTIHGRAFGLELSREEQIRGFKGLNELQHQISGHIVALGLERDRYPDDVLWKILAEKAAAYGLQAHLKHSLESARSKDLLVNQK